MEIICQYLAMNYTKNFLNGVTEFTFFYNNLRYFHRMKGRGRGPKIFELFMQNEQKFLSVHGQEFTSLYDDPNKAVNEFMNDKGFISFVQQKKISSKNGLVDSYKLDFKKLTQFLDSGGVIHEIFRRQPSKKVKDILSKETGNICQITGFKLLAKTRLKESSSDFLIKLTSINYDHKVPLFKGGDDSPDSPKNWMTISEYANREKNKICKTCDYANCNECALAFPENTSTIKPSGQNLKDLWS